MKSVSFSADGSKIASGSSDKTVKVWDVASGALLRTFEGHLKSVRSVSFCFYGRKLVSASWDKTVKVWDVTTGECLQTLVGHTWTVDCVSFSADASKIASGSRDRTIKIWEDLRFKERQRELKAMMLSLRRANRTKRDRHGEPVPSMLLRQLYYFGDILRKIAEYI